MNRHDRRAAGDKEPLRLGEDTITAMARRGYTEFRRIEMSTGARMKEWDEAPILVKATWKDIIGRALGTRGTLVNVNPMMSNPHTLVLTGLSDPQAEQIRSGIEAKLGGTTERPAMSYSDKAFAAEPDAGPNDNLEAPEIAEPAGRA